MLLALGNEESGVTEDVTQGWAQFKRVKSAKTIYQDHHAVQREDRRA